MTLKKKKIYFYPDVATNFVNKAKDPKEKFNLIKQKYTDDMVKTNHDKKAKKTKRQKLKT